LVPPAPKPDRACGVGAVADQELNSPSSRRDALRVQSRIAPRNASTYLYGLKYRDHVVSNLAPRAFAEAAGWPDPRRGCDGDEQSARRFAELTAGVEGGDVEAILLEGFRRAGALVREHWHGIWSIARVLADREYLAGELLDSALAAALRLSPFHRAAEAAWDVEWGQCRRGSRASRRAAIRSNACWERHQSRGVDDFIARRRRLLPPPAARSRAVEGHWP
jgi:hypothetical protein